MSNDTIGWTYEGDVSPIHMSFGYSEVAYTSRSSDLPSVDSIVSFVPVANLQFSVALACNPR